MISRNTGCSKVDSNINKTKENYMIFVEVFKSFCMYEPLKERMNNGAKAQQPPKQYRSAYGEHDRAEAAVTPPSRVPLPRSATPSTST